MTFGIQDREKEGVTVFDLTGRLIVGPFCALLREHVQTALQASKRQFVLNLAAVDYIDSTGLGTMVLCYTSAQKLGGTVKLLNLNRRGLELLLLTKLTTIFDIFNDELEAVNSFFPDREIKKFDILDFIKKSKDQDL